MRQLTGGIVLALFVTACKTAAPVVQQTPTTKQAVIMTLGDKAFTTDDFFQSFTKNQLSADSTQHTDVRQYLDLYTNLKLKVLAAENEKRDTTEDFREEMATYRKQLAQSSMTDRVLVESLAAEAYQRMQQEVNVSHILIPVSENATPADTSAAYGKANTLRKQLQGGQDFAQVARQNSADQTTAQKGGNLGYFTTFSVVYPLETAAYTTPVGGISAPVRTRFGYHLVKVNDKRPSRGRVRVAHILVRISPSADEAGQKMAQDRIETIYARLQKGEAFEIVARETSDDLTSRLNGGLLPSFETGRQVAPFEEAAYSLSKPGELSKPVRTNYGWHIIKLVERKPIDSYVILGPSLRQRVTTDTRADVLRQTTIQRLQKEYAVRESSSVLTEALAQADSSLLRGQWRFPETLPPSLQGKAIVTIADQPYTVNRFFDYVRQKQQPPRNPAMQNGTSQAAPTTITGSPAVAMRRLFDRYVGDQLIATEEANLEKKSPEFRALLGEIRDGVLLSQVMEKNVWERSMNDSTGQRIVFEQNKHRYRFPERAVATIIVAKNDDLLKQATDLLSGRPPYQLRRSTSSLSYDKGQTALTSALRENLFEVMATMTRNPDYIVEVSGSHDASERDSVSAGRIRTVVNFLQQSGISLSRITEKDYQGARPGESAAGAGVAQRRVTFQYFSTAKADIAKVLNSRNPQTASSDEPNITISEGVFAQGASPYLDGINQWKTGTTLLHPAGKAVAVIISRIEPARQQNFIEARGKVINDYQAELEEQWLAQLRQQYPVQLNEGEIRKLAK